MSRSWGALALIAGLMIHGTARADIDVRVGGVGCTFSTIQAAINNANPANGITNILIARNRTYTAQAIDINGKNVRLIGGYADCSQTVRDNIPTVISGSSSAGRSLINVGGATSVVAFLNLTLSSGGESLSTSPIDQDIYGGAVDISGGPHQLVYFENTSIENSRAGVGGGISIRGDAGNSNAVFVQFSYGTRIRSNFAQDSGGGVYCRDATLHLKGNSSTIRLNEAGDATHAGLGGGIFADDCKVRIAGADSIVGSAIDSNVATDNGGGIYAYGSGTRIDVYNADPTKPTRIKGNSAGRFGGAIDIEQGAKVYAWDVVIEGNRAKSGGGAIALYDDGQNDRSLFYLIQDIDSPDLENVASPPAGNPGNNDFAFQCNESWNCAVIQDNVARDDANTPMPGSVFRVSSDDDGSAAAFVLGGRMTRNDGQVAVRTISSNGSTSNAQFQANGAVIDGNVNSTVLIDAGSNTLTQLIGSTIASNVIPSTQMLNADLRCRGADGVGSDYFIVQSTILHQPGKRITGAMPETGCLRYVLGSLLENIPIQDQAAYEMVNPQFTNAAGGDFTLQPSSPALDFAPTVGAFRFTRDGRARSVDLGFDADNFGPVDLGAYEAGAADFPTTDVQVTLTDGIESVLAGGAVAYVIHIRNNGPLTANDILIRDEFPTALACEWYCQDCGSGQGGSGDIELEMSLASGSELTIDAVCDVTASANGTFTNVVSATVGSPEDSTPGNNTASDTNTAIAATDLELTMSDGVATVLPGGFVTYTITARNLGAIGSGNVVVTDIFPDTLDCAWTCLANISAACTSSGSGDIADIATLNGPTGAPLFLPAGEVTYSALCEISATATGSIVNAASVTPNPSLPDPDNTNNSRTDTNSVGAPQDLRASISVNAPVLPSDGVAVFVAEVINDSPIDTVAGTTAFQGSGIFPLLPGTSCSWTCSATAGSMCTAAGNHVINDAAMSLLPGGRAIYVQTCVLPGNFVGDLIGRVVAAMTMGGDVNPANNSASATIRVSPRADVAVSMSDGTSQLPAGQSALYRLAYDNIGPNIVTFTAETLAPSQCAQYEWACMVVGIGDCAVPAGSGAINSTHVLGPGGRIEYDVLCVTPASASGQLHHAASYRNGDNYDPDPSNDVAVDDNEIISADVVFRNGFETP